MNYTRTGRHIYAIGSNVDAARLSGVNVFKTTSTAYLISAFCSFTAGLIMTAQAGMGNMQAGLMFFGQFYCQTRTLVTRRFTTYLRMMAHLGIVAVFSLSFCHPAVDDTRILAMGHDGEGRCRKYLLQRLLTINEHIAC